MKNSIAASLLLFVWGTASAADYQLRDMGFLPGYGSGYSVAYDINNAGDAALVYYKPSGEWQGALYNSSTNVPIGLGTPADWQSSSAYGINNVGQMAGSVTLTSGGQIAISSTASNTQVLGQGMGLAINDAGQVVGISPAGPQWWDRQATVWTNGTRKVLGTLGSGENSQGVDINNAGHAVGYSEINPARTTHAFIFDGQSMKDLGVLPGGDSSGAFGINDHDQVVGVASGQNFTSHAVLWENGSIQDLGALTGSGVSRGLDINNFGAVVGSASTVGGATVAMIYKDGVMRDLNAMLDAQTAASWKLLYANAINDKGWIVGEATFQGRTRAFLLTPVPEADVTSMALGGMAMIALILSRRNTSRGRLR